MFSGATPHHTRAIWMLLLANLYWGLSFPLIKALAMTHAVIDPGAPEALLAVYTIAPRFLMAVLILGVWQWRELRAISGNEWRQGLTLALFASGGMWLQNYGLLYTEASTSAFLTQLYAILIPIWTALRMRRSPGGRVWVAALLVLAGVAVLGRFDWLTFSFGRGETVTLLSSLFFMGQILTLENPRYAGNRAIPITFVMCLTEALIFWALAIGSAPSMAGLSAPWHSIPWVGMTALLALFCTVGAFILMNGWQPKITATEAGLIYCVEPVFGSVMALFLPAWFSLWAGIAYANEQASWELWVGGVLITLANVWVQLKPMREG